MTLVQQARQWLETLPGVSGFRWSYGPWTEQPGRIIALWQDGGRQVAAEDYPVVRVVLVGYRDTRADAVVMLELAAEIRNAANAATCIGDSVRVTPIGGIVGPGFTAEGRAWVEINLEFLI
mgnify:CR=1 FL=1